MNGVEVVHLKAKKNKNDGSGACWLCDYVYEDYADWEAHMKQCHHEKEKEKDKQWTKLEWIDAAFIIILAIVMVILLMLLR